MYVCARFETWRISVCRQTTTDTALTTWLTKPTSLKRRLSYEVRPVAHVTPVPSTSDLNPQCYAGLPLKTITGQLIGTKSH
jgi:hypothetical protein